MKIIYSSENKIYSLENGSKTEIPCGRIIRYKETVESIRRRNEWKTTGKGAQFIGAAADLPNSENIAARITGLGVNNGKLVYGVSLDESNSLYSRSFDRSDENEGLILSGNFSFGSFDCYEGRMAVSMGEARTELHIAVMEPPSSHYTEYTDGDTVEESPWWSRAEKDRIYFSTAGNARTETGSVGAVSPRAGAYIDIEKGVMEEILSDEKYDFLKLRDDKYGNLYFIRQPYGGEKPEAGLKFTDILLFPFRLIKGMLGFLNFFCTIWGGEPLKSGSSGLPGGAKTKDRKTRDIIIDGNIIKAERLAKEQDMKDGEVSGIMPHSRILIKREPDGNEIILAKGVLDYALSPDGAVIISNGRQLTELRNGKETAIAKAHLAMNLAVSE